ncbi:hypothetical protein [Ralstonia sp. ASV6]|uniref:hypothetical protein n=1 Tax=Ralstonia sp. ASV6 TaxID=2795124 RepID=UPI0018EDBEAA|nr:hypothetical protein [Ralstonia sp. ASV6]
MEAKAAVPVKTEEGSFDELPKDDEAFDAYVANESFAGIQRVAVMEQFLLRAARRFHVLERESRVAVENDQVLPDVKQKAWAFLYDQFMLTTADLRMFFSETDDFHGQSREVVSRLNTVADVLVCSGKDVAKIEYVERLVAAAQEAEKENSAGELTLRLPGVWTEEFEPGVFCRFYNDCTAWMESRIDGTDALFAAKYKGVPIGEAGEVVHVGEARVAASDAAAVAQAIADLETKLGEHIIAVSRSADVPADLEP